MSNRVAVSEFDDPLGALGNSFNNSTSKSASISNKTEETESLRTINVENVQVKAEKKKDGKQVISQQKDFTKLWVSEESVPKEANADIFSDAANVQGGFI